MRPKWSSKTEIYGKLTTEHRGHCKVAIVRFSLFIGGVKFNYKSDVEMHQLKILIISGLWGNFVLAVVSSQIWQENHFKCKKDLKICINCVWILGISNTKANRNSAKKLSCSLELRNWNNGGLRISSATAL